MSGSGAPEPRVAVIVPCHDDGDTLTESVDSVRAEPTSVELVVVDDGSSDPATLRALEQLEAAGVRLLRQTCQGPSAAVMAGVRATTAAYVMRLDADDVLERGAIGDLADALDRRGDAAVAWGDVQTFGLTTFRIPAAPLLDPWLLTYVNCVPGAGCLLRRRALLDAGGLQLRDGHEDWDLWLALAERGQIGVYLPRVTFHYRRDRDGRLAASLPQSAAHYESLRQRHESLWERRALNRRASPAPIGLKLAVSAVERLPYLSRLAKIHLCELFTHLLWNGGFAATARMASQAAAVRLGRTRRTRAEGLSEPRRS